MCMSLLHGLAMHTYLTLSPRSCDRCVNILFRFANATACLVCKVVFSKTQLSHKTVEDREFDAEKKIRARISGMYVMPD